MIKRVSLNLARRLGTSLQSNDREIEVYSYALEVLLCSTIKFMVIMGTAYLLGGADIAIFYLISFILLRRFGGGVHCSTYARCLMTGLLSTIFAVKLAESIFISSKIFLFLLLFLIGMGGICIFKWVPAGTQKHNVTQPQTRRQRKIKTAFAFIGICILSVFFYFFQYFSYAFSMILGGFFSLYLITPIGYKTIDIIENKFHITKEERRENNA
ncbi:accessory gene regulator ArgB-like protein [Garciella nitratireducens]|uniref:accessory gene regulator ArgB-like protein n=1 Tax=Garciella nitratireducens TaxID=218205 RepID=UPI001BD69EBC|nr:accessory gene regulator B family protein [Garciella nitratireducens]